MTTSLAETVVGKIVARNPDVARVFEKYQIDYCCRGGITLVEACKIQNVELEKVAYEIEQVQQDSDANDEKNWNDSPLNELADHIVEKTSSIFSDGVASDHWIG